MFKKWFRNFIKGFKMTCLIMIFVFGLGFILLGPACIIVMTGIESLGWIYLLAFPTAIGYVNACLEWIAER